MYGKWQTSQWEPWLLQLGINGTKKPTGFGWTKLAWMEWYIKMNIMMRNVKTAAGIERDENRKDPDHRSETDRYHLEVMMVTARMSSRSTNEHAEPRSRMPRDRSRSRSPDRLGGF
eukprot:13275917-Heterocapsa_arctica.AAC.1